MGIVDGRAPPKRQKQKFARASAPRRYLFSASAPGCEFRSAGKNNKLAEVGLRLVGEGGGGGGGGGRIGRLSKCAQPCDKTRPAFAKFGPELAVCGPLLAKLLPMLTNFGLGSIGSGTTSTRDRPHFAWNRPTLSRDLPSSCSAGQGIAKMARNRPRVARAPPWRMRTARRDRAAIAACGGPVQGGEPTRHDATAHPHVYAMLCKTLPVCESLRARGRALPILGRAESRAPMSAPPWARPTLASSRAPPKSALPIAATEDQHLAARAPPQEAPAAFRRTAGGREGRDRPARRPPDSP